MKILIINPFGIGDVLFTTPLISNLRMAYPQAFIAYVANRRSAPIVECNPKINKVYIYDRDEFKDDLIRLWSRFYFELSNQKFDLAIDFSLNAPFGAICWTSGIKRRIGYNYKDRGRFLTDRITLKGYENRHMVEHYLDLLGLINVPVGSTTLELPQDQASQKWAEDWIKSSGIDLRLRTIGVIPGGGASWGNNSFKKRWPMANYAALLDKMIAKSKTNIILMGDKNEQPLIEELTQKCPGPSYNAVGQTTLLQMVALLRKCHLIITNDGGPLHLAVAAGIKTVSIFGPVDPIVYGPFPSDGHVVIQKKISCQPCYRQFQIAACDHLMCLNAVSVEEVFNQIERLL